MSNQKRFVETYSKDGYIILQDIETGVNYLFVSNEFGSGLTPLLNKEGKPIVTKVNWKKI